MNGTATLAGWLLVAGPVLGLIPVGHPALISIWRMPPDAFAATAAAHRVAWAWLNAWFVVATILTTAGLTALASASTGGIGAAALLGCALAYGIGGTLWCVVLAIRTRTTPLLADLGGDVLTSREGAILAAAMTALFQAFVLITSATLAALGLVLLLNGTLTAPVAAISMLVGIGGIGWLLATGDVIPAVLYAPTLVVGAALLL